MELGGEKKTDEYESFAVTAPPGFKRQLSDYLWPNEAFCSRFHCFFFFVIHYSSLTSRSEIRATGRENEQNSAKLSRQGKKERKGKEREGSRREGRDDWSRSVIRRLRGSPSVDA